MKKQGNKNHWNIARVQRQTKLAHEFSFLHRDPSRKDWLECLLSLQSMCISLSIKKGTIIHDLPLSPRSDNSKLPSGWCLGSFITGLSYFWCLIISGGVSYTIGSHSNLSLAARLLTTSRREKNKIKTHSAEANDDNWKKPTLRMRKERVIWDVGCVWKVSSLGASLAGQKVGNYKNISLRKIQEYSNQRNLSSKGKTNHKHRW